MRKTTSLLSFQYYGMWFCEVFRHISNFKKIYFSLRPKTFISAHLIGNCTLKNCLWQLLRKSACLMHTKLLIFRTLKEGKGELGSQCLPVHMSRLTLSQYLMFFFISSVLCYCMNLGVKIPSKMSKVNLKFEQILRLRFNWMNADMK